jgi:hypothetical protein
MTRRQFEKGATVILAILGSREKLHKIAVKNPEWKQYYTSSYNFNLSTKCKLRKKK